MQVAFKLPLQLKWRRLPDMPFGMGDYVQSVLVQGILYIGGGSTGLYRNSKYIVMAFDLKEKKWAKLPPYGERDFAMTAIRNELVLVGGLGRGGNRSEALGVWKADSAEWTYPYPNMPTARSICSVVVYREWLVVVGGKGSGGDRICSVEVMNIDTKQWHAAPPTPVAFSVMKTAVLGDTCYFMGGYIDGGFTNTVYSVSLPAIVSQQNSDESSGKSSQLFQDVSRLPTYYAGPLSINGSLLALGGADDDTGCNPLSTILLYRPETNKWVQVGDVPCPGCSCTCTVIAEQEFFMAGGNGEDQWNKAYIAQIS